MDPVRRRVRLEPHVRPARQLDDLAAERGTYSSFKGSKWDRGLLPQDTLDLLEKERVRLRDLGVRNVA